MAIEVVVMASGIISGAEPLILQVIGLVSVAAMGVVYGFHALTAVLEAYDKFCKKLRQIRKG